MIHLTALILLGVLAPAPLQSSWYVDDDADCTIADGSQQRPFCTLQDALDAALPGDWVLLLPGSYGQGQSAVTRCPVTIEAVAPGSTTLHGFHAYHDVTLRGLIGGAFSGYGSRMTLERCDLGSALGHGTLEANHCRFQWINWWDRINLERCLVTYELRAAPEGAIWPLTQTEIRHCTIKLITHLNGGGFIYSSIVNKIANFPDWGELGGYYTAFDSCVNHWYQLLPKRCIDRNPRLDPVTYQPQKRSPCIDASGESGGVDGDLDGMAVWDMGAFEYQHPRAYGR